MRRAFLLAILAMLSACLVLDESDDDDAASPSPSPNPTASQSGMADTSFGFFGSVTFELDGGFPDAGSRANAVDIDHEGRVLVHGSCVFFLDEVPPTTFTARILEDGTFDPSFRGTGIFVREGREATAMARQGTSILAAGGNASGMTVRRITPAGDDDPGFPLVATSDGGWANALGVLPDGRFYVGGRVDGQFAVYRRLADGSPDPSWAAGGAAMTAFPTFDAEAGSMSMLVESDESVTVAGHTSVTEHPILARFEDGELDPSFGTGGVVVDSSSTLRVWSIARTPGGWYLGGSAGADGRVVRVHSDGARDSSWTVTSLSGRMESVTGIAIDDQQRVLVVGGHYLSQEFRAVRFAATGVEDATFGTNGGAVFRFGPGRGARANVIAIQPDGKIVVAGDVGNDLGVVRFLP